MNCQVGNDITNTARKVVLIGWDAAEWKMVRALVGRGLMPNVATLMGRGDCAILQAGHPLLSPTVWTSIVTGQHPTRHAVLGAVEVDENGQGMRAIGKSARKAPAIWSILNQAGIACHSINFPATHPIILR
jgi:predicted AlkP superfamily phosphohydrolase/phosphomutase